MSSFANPSLMPKGVEHHKILFDELRGLAEVAGWTVVDVTEPDPSYLAVMRPC